MELAEISGTSMAKRLASCKQSSRNCAVRLLCSWLPNRNVDLSVDGVSDAELIKIWKGLFFCVWHSDKLENQLELINRVAALLSCLPPQLAARYFESFLITIRREWSGIDFLRLDKFYLLIRRFLHYFFVFLRNNSWNLELTARMVNILSHGSMHSIDKFPASGVNYHITEIFLDEIAEFLPLDEETLDVMLNPFISAIQITTDKILVNKIKVNIFDRLAGNGSKLLFDVEAGGEVEKFGKIALGMGFSRKFFSLASAAETLQGNRKFFFGLHDRYLKLENDLKKSGVDILLKKLDVDILLKKLDDGISVPDCVCDMETTKVFTTDTCRDNGQIKKKKKKTVKKTFDGTVANSKIKNNKKNSLDSFIESNSADPGEMSKRKKKNKKLVDSSAEDIGAEALRDSGAFANTENDIFDSSDRNDMISFDETLLSNLQKQFEKVAAEAGMSSGIFAKVSKKRKRATNAHKKKFLNSENIDGGTETGENAEMNVKKVRFSMKKNLIWKTQNPLPPQNLRLPPSLTPRGSALKKGLSPGPIRETPPTVKKIKFKGSSVKKTRKNLRSVSSAVRSFRLLQGFSV